jgi:hypothetical protein
MAMRKRTIGFIFIGLSSAVLLGWCRSDRDVRTIIGTRPKYPDKKIELSRLYTIDVSGIEMFGRERGRSFENRMDFDSRGNLYILDSQESKVSVFDRSGRFARSFGKPGQGPDEFSRPSMLFIKGDEIYVLQGFGFDFKVVSLEGEFIENRRVSFENQFIYRAVGRDVYLFSAKTDKTFTRLDFLLRRFEDGRFDKEEILLSHNYPPGLGGPNYHFNWWDWLWISDSGEFFFPEDNLKKFAVVKYDRTGKPALIFGRAYDIREYSKKARDQFHEEYGREVEAGTKTFPASPPVVRRIFQDQKKDIWVVSGETSEDNEDPDYANTIDVFSPKGEWLYSWKTKSISRQCCYRDGKIFRILPIDPNSFDQYIEVYGIDY